MLFYVGALGNLAFKEGQRCLGVVHFDLSYCLSLSPRITQKPTRKMVFSLFDSQQF